MKGKRIRFISSKDEYNTVVGRGDEGTVIAVDSLGTVHVQWDNGSTLGLIPGEDLYEIFSA